MREFPDRLHVNNKEKFSQYHFDRSLCYLRRDITEFIFKRGDDDNTYFDFDQFKEGRVEDEEILNKLISIIIEELEKLGWKCKKAFGNTGIFIYSTEEQPPSCWGGDDEFN